MTWDDVSDVAYYIVQYERPDTGETYSDIHYYNEWTVVGLEPETYYTFTVTAVNEHGSSPPSEQAPVVTLGVPSKSRSSTSMLNTIAKLGNRESLVCMTEW